MAFRPKMLLHIMQKDNLIFSPANNFISADGF